MPKYTLEAGRSILRDGRRFATIQRAQGPGEWVEPTDVDDFARAVVRRMNRRAAGTNHQAKEHQRPGAWYSCPSSVVAGAVANIRAVTGPPEDPADRCLAVVLDEEALPLMVAAPQMVEALREMDANCENRQDEPFVKYVRETCRAVLAAAGVKS